MIGRFLYTWQQLFIQPHMPVDEQRRRGFLALFLAVLTLALVTLGLITFLNHASQQVDLILWLGATLSMVSLLALRYLPNITPVFRLGFAITLAILTYETASGNGQGMAFLWFYFFPPATFFLFGKRGGVPWVIISWAIAALLTLFDGGYYAYPLPVALRFMATYTLVSILSFGLETLRSQYYNQLLAEKASLEAAFQQIQTLHGLLPMCASCKKIRDDSGYWHQVENYLSHHAAVEISSSLCPECSVNLDPTLAPTLAPTVDP